MFFVFLLISPSCQCSNHQALYFIDLSRCFRCPTDASSPRMNYTLMGGNLSLLHFSWRRARYALPLGQMAIFYTLHTTCPSITTFSVAFTVLDVSSIYMWPRAAALRPIDHFSELFNMQPVVGGLTYCSNWEYFTLCCVRTGYPGLGWDFKLHWTDIFISLKMLQSTG